MTVVKVPCLLDSGSRVRAWVWSVPSACWIESFGFRVQGLVFRVQGLESRVPGLGFRVPGSGFQVSGFGCRVSGVGFRVSGVLGALLDVREDYRLLPQLVLCRPHTTLN